MSTYDREPNPDDFNDPPHMNIPPRPKRPWVGLTDDDVLALRPHYKFSRKLIAEVEAKLKEKNK